VFLKVRGGGAEKAFMENSGGRDRGFTLVEMLIVIVILGILAAVTVFAVRGITNEGDETACAVDRQTVADAQEANYGLHGAYGSEADLVANEFLRSESSTHDVTVTGGGEDYTITPVGACASGSGPTTTVGGSGPVSLTWAGFPAESYGSGPLTVVIAGAGSVLPFGNAAAAATWALTLAGPAPTDLRIIRVDTAGAGDNLTVDEMDALLTAPMDAFVWFISPAGQLVENDDLTPVLPYELAISQVLDPDTVCFTSFSPETGLADCFNDLQVEIVV